MNGVTAAVNKYENAFKDYAKLVNDRSTTMELMRADARAALAELERIRSSQKDQLVQIMTGTKEKL